MSKQFSMSPVSQESRTEPAVSSRFYRIQVQGHLRTEWADWFDGMTVAQLPDGTSTLSGWVADQPALHGLLARVRDLGLTLISIGPGDVSP